VASYGGSGWRIAWFVLAGITAVIAVLAFAVIRKKGPSLHRRSAGTGSNAVPHVPRRAVYLSPRIWHLNAVYFAFGFAYTTFMTFFTKRLIADAGYSISAAGSLFMVMGLVSIVCGTLWGSISDRVGRRPALIMIFGLQAVCYLMFAFWAAPAGFTISTVLFGITAWATPAIMATAAGDIVGADLAPVAFGFLTAFQGLGQATGPFVGGSLADLLSSFTVPYLVVAGMVFLAMIGAVLLPRGRPSARVQ
jgi:predicted MFS family arabinose efflux permease